MKYLFQFFLTAGLLVLLAGGVSWFFDPFGMYWSPLVNGINKIKPESGKHSRVTKAYRSASVKPDVLIVGNSRVEIGINPESALFNKLEVYNLGMPGAGVKMQYDYAKNVIAGADTVRSMVVSVDFLDFLVGEKFRAANESNSGPPGYWPRLMALNEGGYNAALFRFQERFGALLSLDALSASALTLISQRTYVNSISPKGFNSADGYIKIINYEGIKPLFTQKLDEIRNRLRRKSYVLPAGSSDAAGAFLALLEFLQYARGKELKIDLFINPYHYSYLQLIYEAGYGDLYQKWRSELVELMSTFPEQEVQFWDFSLIDQYTLEGVPLNSLNPHMQWFWEPAHYKKELGDVVLERMRGNSPGGSRQFGSLLSLQNLDEINARERAMIETSKPLWESLKFQLGYSVGLSQ